MNSVDNDGDSALYWAVRRHNIYAVKLLLNVQNIDVNLVNKCGRKAVHLAVIKWDIEVFMLLRGGG